MGTNKYLCTMPSTSMDDETITVVLTSETSLRSNFSGGQSSSQSDTDRNVSKSRSDGSDESENVRKFNTKLLLAIERGASGKEITRLLNEGANPNASCWLNYMSACHLAALNDDDSLSILIEAGANSSRTDGWGRTPLHLAAWAGNTKHISLLLNNLEDLKNTDETLSDTEIEQRKLRIKQLHIYKPCDVGEDQDLPKEWRDSLQHTCMLTSQKVPVFDCGWTALHSACSQAQYNCLRLLLNYGTDPNVRDFSGRTPLDVVGDQNGFKQKITVEKFLKTINDLKAVGGKICNIQIPDIDVVNTSLHVAVELRSEEAIRELLDAGAKPMWHNSNGLTALHLCVEYQLGPHLELIANYKYYDKYSQDPVIEVKDKNGLTVLHAAVRAQWIQGVCIAFEAGARILTQGNDGEGPIHYAVAKGNVEMVQMLISFAPDCINEKNEEGQTAIIIAIIHNHLEIVKLLLRNNASLRIISPYRNAFHFAAEYGRVEILKLLLSVDENVTFNLINERFAPSSNPGSFWSTHGAWYTPIIYAIEANHPICVDLLLRSGARIDMIVPFYDKVVYRKIIWATALNIAAIKNHLDIAKKIINFDRQCINLPNSVGVMPLHEACIHGNKEMIKLLIKEGADLSVGGVKLKPSIELLINHISNPTEFMEEILDSNISSRGGQQEKDYKVKIDYSILWQNVSYKSSMKVIKALINTGNRHGQRKLLLHPLIESFLYLQWKALQPFFYLILVLYGLFTISVNVYTVSIFYYQDGNKFNVTKETIASDINLYRNKHVSHYLYFDVWKVMIYTTFGIIITQEVLFLIATRTVFLETWVKFGALISSLCVPMLVSVRDLETVGSPGIPEWVRLIASMAVLLTWLEMMFLLSRFPTWGIYTLMFEKVTSKVLKILLTFGFLIIGFSLCFMIQFRSRVPFETPWSAVTKTLVMMTSEYDYTTTLENALDIDVSIIILQVIFIIFVIIASIVLMNLMVGVAVHDVTHLEKVGNQKRLQKQVDFLISLQSILSTCVIRTIVPKSYFETFLLCKRRHVVLEPNVNTCTYSKILPRHIKEAILDKAQLQKKKKDEDQNTSDCKLNEIHSALVKDDYLQKTTDAVENLRKDINGLRADQEIMKQVLLNIVNVQSGLAKLRSQTFKTM